MCSEGGAGHHHHLTVPSNYTAGGSKQTREAGNIHTIHLSGSTDHGDPPRLECQSHPTHFLPSQGVMDTPTRGRVMSLDLPLRRGHEVTREPRDIRSLHSTWSFTTHPRNQRTAASFSGFPQALLLLARFEIQTHLCDVRV